MDQTIEQRLSALEKEVAELKKDRRSPSSGKDWHRRIGKFKDDPDYDEAMRLGRQYRRRQPKC